MADAQNSAVNNPVPNQVARVVPNSGDIQTLGRPGASDVFVTGSDDIANMDAGEIAERLTIPQSSGGYIVIVFDTPEGIASPVNRDNPGFVGYGLTAGGAREFVVPNGPIPENAVITIVK